MDTLSKIDILNLTDGSSLYWVHAIIVWIVTWIVQRMLFNAQQDFLKLRYDWMRNLPPPRATTCLVQNIPDEYRTDDKLKSYLDSMLMRDAVEAAYVVRKLPDDLHTLLDSIKHNKDRLQHAEHVWRRHGQDPSKRPRHITATS